MDAELQFPISSVTGEPKRLTIEYAGGFRDGRVQRFPSDDPNEVQEAMGQYLMSGGGRVGSRFRGLSDLGLAELMQSKIEYGPDGSARLLNGPPKFDMNHVYEVVDRVEDDDSIVIRYQYMGLFDQIPPRGPSAG